MITSSCENLIFRPPSKQRGRILRHRAGAMFLAAGLLMLSLLPGRAAIQTWNAQAPLVGPYDGSGNWFTSLNGSTTNWWNGTTDDAGNWTGSTPDNAVIGSGSGTAGNYTINLDQVVSANSVIFTNPGSYTLTNNQLTITTAGSLPGIIVSTNVTATVGVPFTQNGDYFYLGTNSTLNFTGGEPTGGGNPIFQGINQASSAVNFTAGVYHLGAGTLRFDDVTALVTNAVLTGPTRLDIGRNYPGTLTVASNGVVALNVTAGVNTGNNINVSRGQPAVLNVLPGALVATTGLPSEPDGQLYLDHDSASQATLNVLGGIVNVGNTTNGVPGYSSSTLVPITFEGGANTYGASTFAILNQSGGIITASALKFGLGNGYTGNPTNQFNLTGGALYLDVGNISLAQSVGTNFGINLSGGTVGATANWSPACNVPITLGTVNGNVTFQTADTYGDPFTIAISGPLTGAGGLTETGPGNLVLSGANNFAGNTVVSNGTLTIITSGSPTNGSVSLDGTAGGTPSESVQVANVGQHWVINNLTYAHGAATADFNFGAYTPSTTVAPILANGNLACGVTPNVTVEGSAIPLGTYPLIKYAGTLSGTVPTSVTLSGGSYGGYLTNQAAAKTISLVVTQSGFNPLLTWAVGNGLWNTTTKNWTQFGIATNYLDPDGVLFNDTASGSSPITVTLNQTVNPQSAVVNNSAINYIISGSGALAGANGLSLTKDGTGTLTLSNANTFAGGTILNNGTLSINYGGSGSGQDSAVGTGSLTINGGAIDNTSGKSLTLLTPITQYWNGNFAFAGTTNLDLGTAPVTLQQAQVTVTVNTNILEVDGQIGDVSGISTLVKSGNGTLVLSNYNNSFGGGVTLSAGTLDINTDGALGNGKLTILNGTVLDNTSGADVALNENNPIGWTGNFTFLGTTNLDLGGSTLSVNPITITVSDNTISTEATIQGSNFTVTKNGPGTWIIGGGSSDGGLGLVINQGTIGFNKTFGAAFGNQNLTVNATGSLVMLNPDGAQIIGVNTFTVNNGTIDLNGDSEPFTTLVFNSGVFEDSAPNTISTLTSTNLSLTGTNNVFDVTTNSTLVVDAPIYGAGPLIETDQGILNLDSTNLYTGATEIEAGTLLLTEPGEITNSVSISIAAGATLDATYRDDQTVTLGSTETLTGNGAINGNLLTLAGSVTAPGTPATVGTLTVTNTITLGGNLLLNLNRSSTPTSSQLTTVMGAITYGGTLSVTNVGSALHVGDTFQLFSSAVSGFTGFSLATTDANGLTYTWNNNVAANGSITVASVSSTVNPNPPVIQHSVSGNILTLAWPTNAGWILQAQTNSLLVGLGSNWVNVPGSSQVTSTQITNNPANGSVFYRLVAP